MKKLAAALILVVLSTIAIAASAEAPYMVSGVWAAQNDFKPLMRGTDLYWIESDDALSEFYATHSEVLVYEDKYATLPHDGETRATLSSIPTSAWALNAINASYAWEKGYTGRGVRVALIDSGVSEHADLKGKVEVGYNMLTESEQNTSDNTRATHGTAVAGIIAANLNEEKGTGGLAPDVTIVPIKCFENEDTSVNLKLIAYAVVKAADTFEDGGLECSVINMSLGATEGYEPLETIIDAAAERGVIITAASGNDGGTDYNYPASYENAVSVGSVSRSLFWSTFSQYNDSVYVCAPGESFNMLSNDKKNYISTKRGTSFSVAWVSAAAAIAKQAEPSMTVSKFKMLLQQSVCDLGEAGYDNKYGYGLLDMKALCECIENQKPFYLSKPSVKSGITYISLFNNNPLKSYTLRAMFTDNDDGFWQKKKTLSYGEFYEMSAPIETGSFFLWDEYLRPYFPKILW